MDQLARFIADLTGDIADSADLAAKTLRYPLVGLVYLVIFMLSFFFGLLCTGSKEETEKHSVLYADSIAIMLAPVSLA